jgi:hypothetical protein
MRTLIHNTVQTDRGDYVFNTREEAEAFFIAVSLRENERHSPMAGPLKPAGRKQAGAGAKRVRPAGEG